MSRPCPCHSGQPYRLCCQPYHTGQKRPSPVALMRARYAAYALGKLRYVMQTEHPDSPRLQADKAAFRRALKQFSQTTDFRGLHILAQEQLDDTHATVTFHAILQQNGADASFTECSLFEKRNGRWLYVKPTTGSNWGR